MAFLFLLICSLILLNPSANDSKLDDLQARDTTPTEHFTENAMTQYLDRTYGDQADQIREKWSNDNGWATMITSAQVGDTLALIGPDRSVSWYYFTGVKNDFLKGIYEVQGPDGALFYGAEPISGDVLEEVRANYALIGGLFRKSDNTIILSWYPSGLQEGKRGYSGSISGIDIQTMSQIKHYAWKYSILLIITGGVGMISWIIGEKWNKFFVFFIGYIIVRCVMIIISMIITGMSDMNVDHHFSAPPIDSVTISLTVDLYGPSQIPTQKNSYYEEYKLSVVGTPIVQWHRSSQTRTQKYDYSKKFEMAIKSRSVSVDKPTLLGYHWRHSSDKICENWIFC